MAEDDEREREWEKVDPKDAPDPDADPANLLQAPGPYPIAWEASECALEMVATFLMSASGVTQHFYRSALGTSKSKGKSKKKEEGEEEGPKRGKETAEMTAKSGFDAGVVSVVERAAAAVASGGSVHFVGHGGVGAMALIAVPDAITAFGAAPSDFHAHLGTKGGWGALDPAFDPAFDEHGGVWASLHGPGRGAREIWMGTLCGALESFDVCDLSGAARGGSAPCAVVMSDDLTLDDVAERFPSAGIASVRWRRAARSRGRRAWRRSRGSQSRQGQCAQLVPARPERSVEAQCGARGSPRCTSSTRSTPSSRDAASCLGQLTLSSRHGSRFVRARFKNEAHARAHSDGRRRGACGEDRAKTAIVRSAVLGAEFDARARSGGAVPRAAAAAAAREAVVPVAVLLAGEVGGRGGEGGGGGGGVRWGRVGHRWRRPGRAVSIFALTFDDGRGADPARLLQSKAVKTF